MSDSSESRVDESEVVESKPEVKEGSVEDRLAFLESQNEALKRSGLLLLILVLIMGGSMIYQSSSSKVAVETQGLILSGMGDKPRAAFTTMPNGHLGMLFYDTVGRLPESAQYGSIPYLDGFAMYDRTGRPRIVIGMDANDNPKLDVLDAEGNLQFTAVEPAKAPTDQPAPDATPSIGATPTPGATPASTPSTTTP